MRQTADVLSMVRSHGLPVPRHDLILELADGAVAVVQERLPGSHARHVDADVIDVMVAMNDRFADDVVHLDYSVGNILFDQHGQISGVIDWNFGVARGDRRLALLGMKVHLGNEGDGYGAKPDALDRLDTILAATIDPTLLHLYWAHLTVRRVHWAIENNLPPGRIGQELDLADRHFT